jgi:hypothetical protein
MLWNVVRRVTLMLRRSTTNRCREGKERGTLMMMDKVTVLQFADRVPLG